MTRWKWVGLLVVCVALLAPSAASAATMWGAHVDGGHYGLPQDDPRTWDRLESMTGKRMGLIGLGSPWFVNGTPVEFSAVRSKFDAIRRRGSIPFFTWAPRESAGDPTNMPAFRTAQIAGGRYDAFIRRFATAVRDWNQPMFLRLAWEPNGNWYPWGEGMDGAGNVVNGNRPGDYVRMWRHVVDIFREVGARNVTWTWVVNHESAPTSTLRYPPLAQTYPGAAYVDWTGMDPYNRYPSWLSFDQIIMGNGSWLRDTFSAIKALAPNKPMVLAEVASQEGSEGRKAAWIRDMLGPRTGLAKRALTKAFLWFDARSDPNTMFVDSSAPTTRAFREGIARPEFIGAAYANAPAAVVRP